MEVLKSSVMSVNSIVVIPLLVPTWYTGLT